MATRTRAAVDLRLTRAALFAAVCVGLSAAGHTAASGVTVTPSALVMGWCAVFCLSALLAGRERSLPGIAGMLLGGQLALHTLFGLVPAQVTRKDGGFTAPVISTSPSGHMAGGHPHHGRPGAPSDTGMGQASGLDAAWTAPHDFVGSALSTSFSMFLGHLIAAVVTGWFLSRGEVALWRLTRLATEVSGVPWRTALALVRALHAGLFSGTTPVVVAINDPEPPSGRSLLLRHSVIRRGPPRYRLAEPVPA